MHSKTSDKTPAGGVGSGLRAVLAAALGVALLGSGAASAEEVLRIGAPANPSSLDPATGGAGSDHVLLYPIYDTLVTWEYETLEARPGLARSWAFTDPQTLVLQLREGVTFHDGTRFDAEAVKFNLDRNRTSDRSNIQADLASIDSVEVTGDLEVTLHLNRPDAALPLILSDRAGMMVSPASIDKHGEQSDRNPVGAGPMKFVSWDDGASVKLTAYEDYWRAGYPKVDGMEFKIIENSSTRLRAVMSGQADVAYALDGRQLPLIERNPRLNGHTSPTVYVYRLYLNSAREPLDDVRVRKALSYAIDREAFVKATMSGAGEVAWMSLPEAHWAHNPEVAGMYEYNPEKARKLLAEAGYPDGITLDMRGYNDQTSIQREELLLEQLEKAGIKGRFTNGTIAEASAAFFGSEKAGDMLLSAWTGRPDPTLTYSLLYSGESYYNPGRVAPPSGYMDAIARSRASGEISERKAALQQAQKLAVENALAVPLAFRMGIVATRPEVKGFKHNLLGKPKFKEVSLER